MTYTRLYPREHFNGHGARSLKQWQDYEDDDVYAEKYDRENPLPGSTAQAPVDDMAAALQRKAAKGAGPAPLAAEPSNPINETMWFLEHWPTERMHLWAKVPDGIIEAHTFDRTPDGYAGANSWIAARNGKMNLYFVVNDISVTLGVDQRDGEIIRTPKETDVTRMVATHVDSDPRVPPPTDLASMTPEDIAAHYDAEKTRLLGMYENYQPRMNAIVFTGGGMQGYHLFKEPIAIDGDEAKIAEWKRLNIFLKKETKSLNADKCESLQHVMRLPGSTNLPDAKKAKRGRTPTTSHLVRFDGRAEWHDAATLPKAAPDPKEEKSTSKTQAGPASQVTDIDDPRIAALSPRGKTIMEHGCIPGITKEGDKDVSRSGWLFDFLGECKSAGLSDPLMTAIITDARWKVSGPILDNPNSAAEAARQIKHAHDKMVDREPAKVPPEFDVLNRDHFVIGRIGSKCRIGSFTHEHGRRKLVLTSTTDFAMQHPQPMLKVEWASKKRPLGEAWAKSAHRRFYPTVTFNPCGPRVLEDGSLNLWQGWGIEPREGDWHLMYSHIHTVLANGHKESTDYIIRWNAWAFQNPDLVALVALCFRSDVEGAGKGVFLRMIKRCWGQHGFQTSNSAQVLGRFNNALRDCCYLYLNEMVAPKIGSQEHSNLKTLITEPTFPLEEKGLNVDNEWPNRAHVVMDGNAHHFAAVSASDRRHAIFDVPDIFEHETKKDAAKTKYFTPLYAEIEAGGAAAMLFDLLRMPLGDWTPYPALQNAAHREQKSLSMTASEILIEHVLQDGHLPGAENHRPDWCRSHGQDRMNAGLMDESFRRTFDHSRAELSEKGLAVNLKGYATAERERTKDIRGWRFKPLAECRATWEQRHGGSWAWETALKDWKPDPDPIPF